jgi:hypothetical protein
VKLLALLAAAAFALAAAPSAHAAAWARVTAAGGSSIDQVSALRTADGVLHVAWRIQSGPNTEDLWHTTIGPDGKVGATVPIATGWVDIEDPGLTAVPGGIRVFWGGIHSDDTTDPNFGLNTALSTDGGASWQVQTGVVAPNDAQVYASDVNAATLADGTTLQTWYGTLGAWVHSGLDPATPNSNFEAPLGSYGYNTGIAAAGATATLAWFSSAAGHLGVLAQGVGHDGAPLGAPQTLPGSATMEVGTVTRTPIAARVGGGYYVTYATGYPSADRVRVWKVGATKATLLDSTDGGSQTTVAADPKGRIWVVWSAGTFGAKQVFAARSNPQATTIGAPVDVGLLKGTSDVDALDASATGSSLDLLALLGVGTESGGSTYVTRVLPGLTLEAKPSTLGRKAVSVSLRVTDAGTAVKGAKVKAAGQTDTTDATGRATLKLKNKATVTASAKGYESASVKLK